jgi:hypothetical protein
MASHLIGLFGLGNSQEFSKNSQEFVSVMRDESKRVGSIGRQRDTS